MEKKVAKFHRRPWFLWIGGACFLAGSLTAGSFSLASSAGPPPTVVTQGTPGSQSWPVSASQSGTWQQELFDGTNVLGTPSHPLRTDPTGTTTQPVNGNVGITDGSNVLGTPTHPLRTDPTGATTQPVSGTVGLSPGSSDIGTVHVAAPSLSANTVNCQAADSHRSCDTSGLTAGTIIATLSANCSVLAGQKPEVAYVSLSGEITIPLSFQQSFNGIDDYFATLTNVNFPVPSGLNFFSVAGDYVASGTNGASCYITYVSTSG